MFKPVEPKPDFPKLERMVLESWSQSGIVKKYLQKNQAAKKKFSFFDGPITANNPMGVHHAWGRTYKDLWQRFKNMQGFRQRFQNGFDNQGLWVEVEVEKELGFKNKKEIEKYGIEKFVEKCKERTLKFAETQTGQSKRLGYFMDWDNSYLTMSDENNYMIWYFLKKCWQDGNLYKGRDSVPWCPRCGTAISQHEILQEEYHTLTHETVVLKFPAGKNEYFLAWTTTPWSIPGTIALMINPEFTYVRVRQNDVHYLLAKERLSALKGPFEVIEEFKGEKLVGRTFKHPYQNFPSLKGQKFPVIPSEEFVTLDVGTGIVTNNPGVGHEDYLAAKKVNLEPIESIDAAANFLPGYSQFSGRNAKDNQLTKDILEDLKEKGFVYDIYDYSHRYPVCWRCKTELVFRLVDEWYIAMDKTFSPGAKNYRQRLMAIVKEISWIPEWGLERELDWLKNMEDWLISKKRYWGLALPIWECSCGHFEVVGSKEELKEKAVSGWKEFEGQTPHRPWIDRVRIKCSACGKTATRITDVGNPWLDAGIISFSTLVDPKTGKVSYLTDKKYWRDWFPADFITESFPGQFKNWFYSLLAMSTVLENSHPFKTVLGFATLLAEDGQPMHKSLGNAIEFNEGADKIGVDVMRWMYVTQNPADNLLFGYHKADEVRRRFHLMLWNIYNFFVVYANIDKWERKTQNEKRNTNVLDRWILSRLNHLIQLATQSLENFDAFTASQAIEDFVNDLSTWYVRRSRNRVGLTAPNGEDKNACYQTLYEVLVTLTKILAPFTPFLAEEIYKNLTGEESVHLEDWPQAETGKIDESLEEKMALVRKICELGHAARKEAEIKVRQPLSSAKCKVQSAKLEEELLRLIKDELNVKEVVWEKKVVKEPEVKLETKLTPQLKAEGEAREIVRQIQDLRKNQGCRLDEKIIVTLPSWPQEFEVEIKRQTLTKKLIKGKQLKISS